MSIRLRLTLWYVSLLAIILIMFSGALYAVLSLSLFNQVDRSLESRAVDVSTSLSTTLEVQTEPRILLSRRGGLTLPTPDAFSSPGIFVQITTLDGVAILRSANLEDQTLAVSSAALTQVTDGESVFLNLTRDRAPLRVYVVPLTVRNNVIAAVVVAESLQGAIDTLRQLAVLLITGIIVALLIASIIGFILAGTALAPISRITQTAQSIAHSNDLSRRIEEKPKNDEVGRLAATFNEMLGRIEELFRAQQRFVADVSHELRSPLTAIRGNLDLLRRGAMENAEGRQSALAAVDSEASRMQRLVVDLLLLAQADAGIGIQKQIVELDTLLLDVYRQVRLTAPHIKVNLGGEDQIIVNGDPDRLKQLFLNLMDNAVKYTPNGGQVTLSFGRADNCAQVSVTDTGVGIPPQDLPKVFDRFYRVDKARTRDSSTGSGGGTGLGLSIAKWIVDQHEGTIDVTSQVGKGTTFIVRLPLANQNGTI